MNLFRPKLARDEYFESLSKLAIELFFQNVVENVDDLPFVVGLTFFRYKVESEKPKTTRF
jgi:hypothetical protein